MKCTNKQEISNIHLLINLEVALTVQVTCIYNVQLKNIYAVDFLS